MWLCTCFFKTKPKRTTRTWCQGKPWHYLLGYNVGSLGRIMAVGNEVADILTVDYEVNTVCSKDQEAVVCMMQLQ